SCWWPCPSCGPVRPWRKEMVEKNLPPLPDSCMITYEFPDGAYDSESMTAYGRACYEAAISAHRVDDDTYTDENGTVWTRPTAWAYAQACKARDKWQAKAAQKADDARDAALRHNWNEHLIEHNALEYQHDFPLFKVVEAYVLKHLADRHPRRE